jgi:hypothetical protein
MGSGAEQRRLKLHAQPQAGTGVRQRHALLEAKALLAAEMKPRA